MFEKRTQQIEQALNEQYELIVIGGGITGAGIALDASSRGIKTLLLEKRDFASGTSSKSTKLIHGGLRYLKQLEFKLVADVGRERAVVHRLAPNLVHPTKMILPFIQDGKLGKVSTFMALTAYDWLANVQGEDKKQMMNVEEAVTQEPLLKNLPIQGAGYYAEYRTDDSRLTIEVIKKAVSMGAHCFNYCEVTDFVEKHGKLTGLEFTDNLSNKEYKAHAPEIINATGPWVDTLRQKIETIKGKRLQLTKGVHIVVSHDKLPVLQPVYFDTNDDRMIFAIPRLNKTYIGTTDTVYDQDINEVYATSSDVKYIMEQVESYFKNKFFTLEDIESTWAGLRPLIHEDGKDPSELSRKDEIFESTNGLLSIAGGKLTGYRTMSKRIVDIVAERLNNEQECKTEEISLGKNSFSDYDEVLRYTQKIASSIPSSLDQSLEAEYLVSNYGKDSDLIIAKSNVNHKDQPKVWLLLSEVEYLLDNEMIYSSEDYWIRRTGSIYFRMETVKRYKEVVNDKLATSYSWSEAQKALDLKQIEEEISKTLQFKVESYANH